LEDLRLGPVSERKAKLEAELRENEREIERLTRLQEERGAPLDLDELRLCVGSILRSPQGGGEPGRSAVGLAG
jgi:hypothetical protein